VPCPACEEPTEPGTSFCTSCGEALVTVAPTPPEPVPQLPGPQEERRFVSVLAVDLVGFSGTAQGLEPEDLRAAQRSFFAAVATEVLNADGTVAKRIGDAVIAVFGAPVAHENDPQRAVTAAMKVQEALVGHELPDGRPLRARAGVASGEAIVTTDPARDAPHVAGEVLSRAMTLQAAAPPGAVLVGTTTHRLTCTSMTYEEHAVVSVGSRGAEEQTWLATDRKDWSGRLGDTLPLVGREPELALLVSSVRRVLQERRGQLVALVGDAGIGKSRLTRGLGEHLESPASPTIVRWRTGVCLPYGEGVSYWALGQVVKAQAGILESDSAAVARRKLEASVDRLLPPESAAPVKESLLALLGLPGAAADPSDDVAASHTAWRRYVLALAEDTPTVLVLEDLQWADDGFLDFLRSVVEAAGSLPLLLLCTARPELMQRRPDWLAGLRDAMTITLTPLAEQEAVTVLSRLLGGAVLPPSLLRRLLDRVGGNPLYAEEYIRMLADSGVLQRAPGTEGFEVEASMDLLADLPLPDSLQGVVDSRLDLLTAAERSVVSAAAVVGEVFWDGAVAAVAGASREEVLQCLEALERREVVRRSLTSTVAAEQQFAFRHVLVRDAAYGRIPRSLRVMQHQRCADWLDSSAPDRGDDVAELRAYHRATAYELAAVLGLDLEAFTEPARTALLAASEHALRVRAVSAGHAYARRALMLWHGREHELPALHTALQVASLAFLDDPHAFYSEGGPAKVAVVAEQLLALGDRRGAARAEGILGQVEWYRASDPELAAVHLQRAVDLMALEPSSEQGASALAELSRLRMLCHQYADAVALADRAAAVARPLGLLEVEANALVTAGSARYFLGDPLGIVQQEEALRLCREHGLRALQRAANNLAATMQEEGRLRRSYELIEESSKAARSWGLSLTTRADDAERALMAWYDGDWRDLQNHTDAFLENVSEEVQQWESHLIALTCVVHALRGEEVPERLVRVVERARASGFPSLVRSAQVMLGCARFLEGRRAEAEVLFDELLSHADADTRGSVREWGYGAALLASFLGNGRLERVSTILAPLTPKTPWVQAAEHAARSFTATEVGKHQDAYDHALDALAVYERVGDLSTAAFARVRLTLAAAAVGEVGVVEEQSARVREFVAATGATRFLKYLPR
jgi:class 3 adenylate cyclase